jgi:hypothetical protein
VALKAAQIVDGGFALKALESLDRIWGLGVYKLLLTQYYLGDHVSCVHFA